MRITKDPARDVGNEVQWTGSGDIAKALASCGEQAEFAVVDRPHEQQG